MKKLTPRPLPEAAATEPFADAEEAWLWFWHCQRLRDSRVRLERSGDRAGRPCDPDDIYRAVRRLQAAGRLGRGHLLVLVRYGQRQRPPDPRLPEEAVHADLWRAGLDRLHRALADKGLVQPLKTGESGDGHGR
ncbi:hypothetical protein [Roseospirillum parvum]|uniref:Uncharacterized protein n=1 Tax=Roseospirillum parvum TaxID=83401 RepID=A0A1G7W7S2_9PROT|nr:hypothetical protein [Roseospirillum parvum]SDG67963.1 hypothetical protein SAMN05421742_102105 [Roseospirillum parvum]